VFIDDVQLFQDNDNPKVLWSQGIVDGKGNSAIIVHGGQWLRIKPTASLNEVSGKYSHALFAELTSPITSYQRSISLTRFNQLVTQPQ
jgi:hypothetical protein